MISMEKIESLGFSNLRVTPPRKYRIEDIPNDPLRYLFNLDIMYIRFVSFDDQVVECDFLGRQWTIFGDDNEGVFGTDATTGRVFHVARTPEGRTDLRICAAEMKDFVSLFNLFVSYIFRLRASYMGGHDKLETDVSEYFLSCAGRFLDEDTLATSYWANMCELIEHDDIRLFPGIEGYLATERLVQAE